MSKALKSKLSKPKLSKPVQKHTRKEYQQKVKLLIEWLNSRVIGQDNLVERLLITLFCNGHLLVEGAPGLAKTRAVKVLAQAVEGNFHRIQFAPDLLPSDITGTEVFRPEKGDFNFQKGPIFHNLVLADEINRAPAKVQSALLEAMAEKQVTVGQKTYSLPELFMVMATQNPIEQEGTYSLPEAQLDRFMMHVNIHYPNIESERKILELVHQEDRYPDEQNLPEPLLQEDLFRIRRDILDIYVSVPVQEYIVHLIMATREPQKYGDDIANWLDYGASPRGTIALDKCSRARAWLKNRDFVTPDDVQNILADVLRHRIILSFEAEAAGHTSDHVIQELMNRVPVT